MALDSTGIHVIGYFEGKKTDNDEREEEFRMYILKEVPSRICENETLFEGLIEDTFGLSIVAGKRDKQHMFFSQRYSQNAIELGAFKREIKYGGTIKPFMECEGEYYFDDNFDSKLGTFSMKPLGITTVKIG